MAKKSRSKTFNLIAPPNWIELKKVEKEEDREAAFKHCDYFVHYEIADKAKVASFHKYAIRTWGKDAHKQIKKLSDHTFITYGKICFIADKLGYITKEFERRLETMKKEWIVQASFKLEEIAEEQAAIGAKKPSIQDHMREQVAPLCEKWDVALDLLTDGDLNLAKFAPHNDIESFDTAIKGPQAKIIRDEYQGYLDEAKLVAAWKDPDIKESYSNTTAKQRKDTVSFYEKIITACETVINTKKVARKSSKPRVVSKEKIVAKLKFQVNEGKLGVASISPIDCIGQNEVWIYNTKNRKLGCYIASTTDPSKMGRSSISFKGTTMTGFDEEKSVQKTLRKPEEQIKLFSGKARTKFNKAFGELTTIDTKMNGRFNEATIILRAF